MGNLTDRECKALVERAKKAAATRQSGEPPIVLEASDGANLILRAGARGGTWMLRWVRDGRPHGRAIGKYSDMGLAAARRAAAEGMVEVRRGGLPLPPPAISAPATPPAPPPAGDTVRDLLDFYIERVKRKARAPKQVEWVCDKLLKPLHEKPAATLTDDEIIAFLRQLEARSESSAYRAGATLRAAWRHCLENKRVSHNPLKDVKLPASGAVREITLSPTELARVWHSDVPVWSRLARVLLLTGLRLREAANAPVSELHEDRWMIPAQRMKAGKPHTLPLFPRLTAELGDLADQTWVFKSPRRFDQPVSGFSRGLELLQREAGTGDHWTWHDLRRTTATGLDELGCPPAAIEKVLAHTPPKLTRTYRKHDFFRERCEWLTRWAAWLDALPKRQG